MRVASLSVDARQLLVYMVSVAGEPWTDTDTDCSYMYVFSASIELRT